MKRSKCTAARSKRGLTNSGRDGMHKKLRFKFIALSAPALIGFAEFYILPFIRSIAYAFTGGGLEKRFVGFENFIAVAENGYFRLALKNTALFSLIGVITVTTLAIILSFGLAGISEKALWIKAAFIAPYILPSASTVLIWQAVFDSNAYFSLTRSETWGGFFAVLPLYLLFIWKNVGIDIIILTAAISSVPREIYEAAALDGAGPKALRFKITLPMISPTVLFVALLSFVNSLKIFRESYLYYKTNYPPDSAYMLQNYMNNHFYKLNYENLSAAAVMFTLFVGVAIAAAWIISERSSKR